MGILEIGLTIWAWKRGWKIWSLLPLAVGVVTSIFTALVLYDAGLFMVVAPKAAGFIAIDVLVIASLALMIARARNKPITRTCRDSPLPILTNVKNESTKDVISSEYKWGVARVQATGAKLVLPDNRDIPVSGTINPVGRGDFGGLISANLLHFVSGQQFWIRYDRGRYFLEDYQSANGTKLNGSEIRGKGLFALHDGDKIDIAGIVVLTFKVSNERTYVR